MGTKSYFIGENLLYELDLKPKKSQGIQGAGELAWCGSISEYLFLLTTPAPPHYRKLKHTPGSL